VIGVCCETTLELYHTFSKTISIVSIIEYVYMGDAGLEGIDYFISEKILTQFS
jgi:hypothetical protein